jgi:hypothetical protein
MILSINYNIDLAFESKKMDVHSESRAYHSIFNGHR